VKKFVTKTIRACLETGSCENSTKLLHHKDGVINLPEGVQIRNLKLCEELPTETKIKVDLALSRPPSWLCLYPCCCVLSMASKSFNKNLSWWNLFIILRAQLLQETNVSFPSPFHLSAARIRFPEAKHQLATHWFLSLSNSPHSTEANLQAWTAWPSCDSRQCLNYQRLTCVRTTEHGHPNLFLLLTSQPPDWIFLHVVLRMTKQDEFE
jgi:hypothetical protein